MTDDDRQWTLPTAGGGQYRPDTPEADPGQSRDVSAPPPAPQVRIRGAAFTTPAAAPHQAGGTAAQPAAAAGSAPRPVALARPAIARSKRPLIAVGAVAAVLAAGVVAVRAAAADPTPGRSTTTAAAVSLTPEKQAWQVAQAQVDALLGDNEQAWLGLVDPAQPEFADRYRTLFRTLRAMKVDHAEALAVADRDAADGATFYVGFSYCFAGSPCPTAYDQPKMVKRVTVAGGRFLHTLDWDPDTIYNLKKPPWGDDNLVVAEGKRVVVAASGSQAAALPQVVAYADQAAVDLDRFGKYVRTPQDRYRIFVADDQDWATWHGGDQPEWAIGYAHEDAGVGMDVILNAGKVLHSDEDPQVVVRHEMGHVLTLISAKPPTNPLAYLFNDPNQWLREGIAEYIGENARPPQTTTSRYAIQAAFRSATPPTSIVSQAVYQGSERRSVHSLYAMGYYAASCMATKYGEANLFHFTDLVLRNAQTAQAASRAAYGKPFSEVDHACLTWIRHHT